MICKMRGREKKGRRRKQKEGKGRKGRKRERGFVDKEVNGVWRGGRWFSSLLGSLAALITKLT